MGSLQHEINEIIGDIDDNIWTEPDPLSLWPIKHMAVNKAHTIRFFSLRRWPTENRKDSIAFVLSKKKVKDMKFVNGVAKEFADFISAMFRNVDGFLVTNAPAGNSVKNDFHLATLMAQSTARLLGLKYLKVFRDYPKKTKQVRNTENKKNTSLKDGISPEKYKGIILIDDASTTRITIETCVGLLTDFFVIPIVWVHNDKVRGYGAE